MGEEARTVSLSDVARAAGVGNATASRALSSRSPLDISAKTRDRVRAVAAELGYSPNRAAQSLRTGQHQALGLIAPIQDWAWWAPVVEGAASAAAAFGHHLVVQPIDPASDLPHILTQLSEVAIDGAVVLTDRAIAADVTPPKGLDVVFVDDITPHPTFPTIRGDGVDGGYQLGRHLRGAGRTAPLVVHSGTDLAYVADRIAGFRQAFAEDGILIPDDRLILSSESMHPETARPAELAAQISAAGDTDAVFATADFLAATVLRALRTLGRHAPQDLAVVGYDDERIAAVVDPPLTTFRQPLVEMGAAAIRTVLRNLHPSRFDDEIPLVQLIPGSLVIRASG